MNNERDSTSLAHIFGIPRKVKKAALGKLIHMVDFQGIEEIIERNDDGSWTVPVHNQNDEGWDIHVAYKKFKTLKAAKEFCLSHGGMLFTERDRPVKEG